MCLPYSVGLVALRDEGSAIHFTTEWKIQVSASGINFLFFFIVMGVEGASKKNE